MSYIGNSPGVASQRVETAFTATSSQTVFTPSSGYTPGYCDVYQNGVKLVNGDDYTAADGVTVTLATGAASGDSIVIVASFPRGLTDGYLKSEADAKYLTIANPSYTGTLTGGTGVVNLGSNQFVKDASGNIGIGLSPSAWASVLSGTIENRSGGLYPYSPGGGTYDVGIFTNAYYDGSWRYKNTGSSSSAYFISASTSSTGVRHTWRVAGTGNAGSAISYTDSMVLDASGNLGVGLSSLGYGANARLTLYRTSMPELVFADDLTPSASAAPRIAGGTAYMTFSTNGSERMRLDASGNLGLGTSSPPLKLTVVGNVKAGYEAATGLIIGLAPSGIPANNVNSYLLWGDEATFGGSNGDLIYIPRTSTNGAHRFYAGNGTPAERARIDSTGNVTKPSNSCFLAGRSTTQTYSSGNAIVFNEEIFDQNSNYNPNTGIFTAPVTGKYLLSATILIQNATVGSNYDLKLTTSNRSYLGAPGRTQYQTTGVSWGDGYMAFQVTQICDMDASDTAYIAFSGFGAGSIYGSSDWTRFSGCLIS